MANSFQNLKGGKTAEPKTKVKKETGKTAEPKTKVKKEAGNTNEKRHVEPTDLGIFEKEQEPPFPGTARRRPIYWGGVTIYTGDKGWRVKLKRGDKKDMPKAFTDKPEEGWRAVIDLCRAKGNL